MEQRRFIIFFILSAIFLVGWLKVGPILMPDAFPKPRNVAAKKDNGAEKIPADAEKQSGAEDPVAEPQDAAAGDEQGQVAEAPGPQADQARELPPLPDFANPGEIILGSMDVDSGYYMELRLDPEGADIVSATLNDPRFITADGKNAQLEVISNPTQGDKLTLATDLAAIDAQLAPHNQSLRSVTWEIVKQDKDSVEFRYPAPDGSLEVRKTYKLNRGDPDNRDGDHLGYLVDFAIEVRNLSDQPRDLKYTLQGPVGLPLENAENTRTFIEVKVGTAEKPGSPVQYTAATFADQLEEKEAQNDPTVVDAWRDPLAYVGVDVQYFAALLIPQDPQLDDLDGDGLPDPTFAEIKPDLVGAVNQQHPERTSLSLKLESRPFTVPAGQFETHSFKLFLGPKRPELLNPLQAGGIITFGWFSFVSVGMVHALNFFHHALWLPYGLAIVLLTLCVRACMFPITRKQASGAKKMKELQPKLQELKTKYSKEPEKFWQAQRELFRKHNYSPLSGCLPLVLQLPIFIGLYSALSFDVDLRMAPFLWFDNLAAPDQLFSFGGELPLVHWTHFNLLPIITICLWVVQQKLFMPPPTTDEQALQYKVMNYMMIFIGFMIYRVPAGLCVYFITSTLWGISERKAIDYWKVGEKKTETDEPIETTATPSKTPAKSEKPDQPRSPGFLERLVAAADEAKRQGSGRPNEPAGASFSGSRKSQRGGKKKRPNR